MITPFYLVCDESQSMEGAKLDACNTALSNIHAAVAADHIVNDKIRIGVISFSDTAQVLLPLSKMTDVVDFSGLVVKGGTNYGNAFTCLKNTIQTDMVDLQKSGAKMCRPIVLFMTDGEPTDTTGKKPMHKWRTKHGHFHRTSSPLD